ncbi:methylenetetrahydrofolate reductase [Desulfococcaceae bacterium HSG9]|nr:methylenetetrahydrofolate reductase [Desulfococcaceae bacterium HSG9]
MKLSELFDKSEFVVTGEVGPVKGAIPRDKDYVPPCMAEALHLEKKVHAINVTDNQSAVMKLGSMAASVKLKQNGFEPIYQITCRDRNRIALQSEILTAFSLGVDNMLLLTGDHTNLGDHIEAKPVFDLDSVQLVKIAADLQKGKDMVGNDLLNAPDFFIGAVVNPNFQPLDLQLIKMKKKIEAGAQFFQTQAVYEDSVIDQFVAKTELFDCPVQLGVVVLKNPAMGKYMNNYISGISVPQKWINEIGSVDKADRKKKSAEMMGRFIRKHKDKFQGVHIMPLGWTDIVPDILEYAEINVNGGIK